MTSIPTGRPLSGVTYFTLSQAAWDRRTGLHELDFGLDLQFDGMTYGVVWQQRGGNLEIDTRSLRAKVPNAVLTDATSVAPWLDLVGSVLEARDRGPSVLELGFGTNEPIWLVAGNYLDESDEIVVEGDSLLVVYDRGLARRFLSTPGRRCLG